MHGLQFDAEESFNGSNMGIRGEIMNFTVHVGIEILIVNEKETTQEKQ